MGRKPHCGSVYESPIKINSRKSDEGWREAPSEIAGERQLTS